MSVIQRLVNELRAIEADLLGAPEAAASSPASVARRLHRVIALLAGEDAHSVTAAEAKRLLGLNSERAVKDWARIGLLRSRTRPGGRVHVLLADVLERRAETEDLTALGGDELSPDELRRLRDNRPGVEPWSGTLASSGQALKADPGQDEAEQMLDRSREREQPLTLVERRAFMRLPLEERRRRLAEQAARMEEHYARDRGWEELEAGDLVDE